MFLYVGSAGVCTYLNADCFLFVCSRVHRHICTCISPLVIQIAGTNYIPASDLASISACVRHPYMAVLGENYFSLLRSTLTLTPLPTPPPLSSSLQVSSVSRYRTPYLHSEPGWIPWESCSRPASGLDRDKRFWLALALSGFGSVCLLFFSFLVAVFLYSALPLRLSLSVSAFVCWVT